MDALCPLWEKMLAPSLSKASVSSLCNYSHVEESALTPVLDLLKTWVEENLDLYKVSGNPPFLKRDPC